EAARIGRFIVDKLNRMEGPVRFLIPEGGVSGLDRPGGPFWDPAANRALFDAIASGFRAGTNRKLLRLPHHINDQAFADALVATFNEVRPPWPELRAKTSCPGCAAWCAGASRSSAAAPAPVCPPSARRPAVSTSSSSTTPAAIAWPAGARWPACSP